VHAIKSHNDCAIIQRERSNIAIPQHEHAMKTNKNHAIIQIIRQRARVGKYILGTTQFQSKIHPRGPVAGGKTLWKQMCRKIRGQTNHFTTTQNSTC